MKILYYECFAGISGDMHLGAMIDLGVPEQHLRDSLKKLNIDGYDLAIQKDLKSGISGTKVTVNLTDNNGHHKPRHLKHINQIIDDSTLNDTIKNLSKTMFLHIAEAEAKIHDKTVESIHFHEVGAVDALVDMLGAAICIDYLNPDAIFASEVELGKGFVQCAHGTFPIPAPATLEILKDIPVKRGGVQGEATTPTGAAILKTLVHDFSGSIAFSPLKTAYGIGHSDFEVPNVLRVSLGEKDLEGTGRDTIAMLETNIDDQNGELLSYTMQRCFDAGALDVFYTPVFMKKNRPGVQLTALCKVEDEPIIGEIIFSETKTLGIRRQLITRDILKRAETDLNSVFGPVKVKTSFYGNKCIQAKPGYETCARIAQKHNLPLQDVQRQIMDAYYTQQNSQNKKS